MIDLGDLSRDPWSLLPGPTDFVAEVHTRRYDTLTYARSASEAEDITVFDRKRQTQHRAVCVEAESWRRADASTTRTTLSTTTSWTTTSTSLDSRAAMDSKAARAFAENRAPTSSTALTLRLADALAVRVVVSNEFGRLFCIRVKNQNTLVVNLPATVLQDTNLTLR